MEFFGGSFFLRQRWYCLIMSLYLHVVSLGALFISKHESFVLATDHYYYLFFYHPITLQVAIPLKADFRYIYLFLYVSFVVYIVYGVSDLSALPNYVLHFPFKTQHQSMHNSKLYTTTSLSVTLFTLIAKPVK